MAINVRLLYKIGGKTGAARQRLEEAMEWLLSPHAEGIGEKLLRDAHKLHGKPVNIESGEGITAYYHQDHRIKIDPNLCCGTSIASEAGVPKSLSMERFLAHELVHAGQKGIPEIESELTLMQLEATNKIMEGMTQAQMEEHSKLITAMAEATDYNSAMQQLDAYIDAFAVPMQEASLPIITADPRFMKHIEQFEMPAIEAENQVARILGEPIRDDYLSSYQVNRDALRSMVKGELGKTFKFDELPGALSEISSWVDKTTKSSTQLAQK